nr:CdaR family protein [Ardenticatena sp.]
MGNAYKTALSNLSSFVLSLILGTIIWMVAVSSENPIVENTFPPNSSIPVQIRNVPPGLVPLLDTQPTVTLLLRAPSDVWAEIDASQFEAWVDLSELGPGLHSVPVQVEQAQPRNRQIRILRARPAEIPIKLDRIEERTFPVEVEIVDRNTIPLSYEVLSPQVEPMTVTVRGPSTKLDTIDRIIAPITIGSARATFETQAALELLDRNGNTIQQGNTSTDIRIVEPLDGRVRVIVPIQIRQGYRELPVQPQIVGEVAPGYWISDIAVTPKTLSVVGLPSVVESLSSTLKTEPLDVTGLRDGIFTKPLRVLLPESVSPLEGDGTVEVTVRVEAIRSSKRFAVKPEVVGLAPGLEVKRIAPETIEVLVEGPISALENLTPDEVKATLDLSNLREGVQLVPPRIRITAPLAGLQVASYLPEQVEVTIGVQTSTRTVERPVKVLGLALNMDVFVTPTVVSITLEGPTFDLQTLKEERIVASVDVSTLRAGVYVLTPTISAPPQFNVQAVEPPTVTVRLERTGSSYRLTPRTHAQASLPRDGRLQASLLGQETPRFPGLRFDLADRLFRQAAEEVGDCLHRLRVFIGQAIAYAQHQGFMPENRGKSGAGAPSAKKGLGRRCPGAVYKSRYSTIAAIPCPPPMHMVANP